MPRVAAAYRSQRRDLLGEALERYRWMLRGYLAATEHAEIALAGITHHHSDHSGNLKWANEAYKAEIVAPKSALPLLKGRLPRKGVTTFEDGQVLDMGGGTNVTVLLTPGPRPVTFDRHDHKGA